MKTEMRTTSKILGISAIALLGLTACGDSADDAPENDQENMSETEGDMNGEDMEEGSGDEPTEDAEGMDPAADLVGAACDDYAEQVPDGDGSVEGMAEDPSPPLLPTTPCSPR